MLDRFAKIILNLISSSRKFLSSRNFISRYQSRALPRAREEISAIFASPSGSLHSLNHAVHLRHLFPYILARARARARRQLVTGTSIERVAAFVAENWRIRWLGTMRGCISYSARSRSFAIGLLSRPRFFPPHPRISSLHPLLVTARRASLRMAPTRTADLSRRKKDERRAFHTRGVNNDDNWSWILPSPRLARAGRGCVSAAGCAGALITGYTTRLTIFRRYLHGIIFFLLLSPSPPPVTVSCAYRSFASSLFSPPIALLIRRIPRDRELYFRACTWAIIAARLLIKPCFNLLLMKFLAT